MEAGGRMLTGGSAFDLLLLVEIFEDLCCGGCLAISHCIVGCAVDSPFVTLLCKLAETSIAEYGRFCLPAIGQ
jgi:hypothetical protein